MAAAGDTSFRPLDDNGKSDDFGCVYRAVAAGESADEVRRVIEACAQGSDERRAAAVNTAGRQAGETPLEVAHRLRRGDLVGLLLEAGADCRPLCRGRCTSPLVLCIAHGQVDSLRALLRTGKHDANTKVAYNMSGGLLPRSSRQECSLVHLCIRPPCLPGLHSGPIPPPQLACLEVLVREGGADVNAREHPGGRTPLHWPVLWMPGLDATVDALLQLGADLNVRDNRGVTPFAKIMDHQSIPRTLRMLRERGASADVIDPSNARRVLPFAVSLMARQQERLAAQQAWLGSWRAHEAMVNLALDARDAREMDEAAEAAERRIEALEQELRELGAGTETDESEEGSSGASDGEGDDESSSDGEAERESGGGSSKEGDDDESGEEGEAGIGAGDPGVGG